jgi:hypothetical protein
MNSEFIISIRLLKNGKALLTSTLDIVTKESEVNKSVRLDNKVIAKGTVTKIHRYGSCDRSLIPSTKFPNIPDEFDIIIVHATSSGEVLCKGKLTNA